MAEDDGTSVLPIWPGRRYAELCATGDWEGYQPRELNLSELTGEFGHRLQADAIRAGVFPTAGGRGVSVSLEALVAALREEMRLYE